MAEDRAIGKDNQLLWRIRDDLKLFKSTTLNHSVIHGRKSYESIGKPLPNRTNIIVTRNKDYIQEKCLIAHSLDEAIQLANDNEENGEIFILGGAQIYTESLGKIDRMYISHVEANFPEADAYFPTFNLNEWEKVSSAKYPMNDRNEFAFDFCIYDRIKDSTDRNNEEMVSFL